MVELYVKLIIAGKKTIEDVPIKYREAVEVKLNEEITK